MASEANLQYKAIALVASSLPGIGKSIPSGLLLESITAITGIFKTFASFIAICSLFVSITNKASGKPPISFIPPNDNSSFILFFSIPTNSFFVNPESSLFKISS